MKMGSRSAIPLSAGVSDRTIALETFLNPSRLKRNAADHDFVFVFYNVMKGANRDGERKAAYEHLETVSPIPTEVMLNFFPDGMLGQSGAVEESIREVQFLSLGTNGGGIDFHNHGDTLFGLLNGEKVWYIYPPGQTPEKVDRDIDLIKNNWKNVSWFAYPKGDANRPRRCRQRAGELLYLPQLYEHATENNGEAIGIGWQLEVQVEVAMQTAENILMENPRNPLALHTKNWFGDPRTERFPYELVDLRPNSINIAISAVQNLCRADGKAGRSAAIGIVERWTKRVVSATATALKAREGAVEAMHVNEGALLTTLSQLLQIADQYQDCLAIGQDSLRTLVEQVRALDPGHVVIKQYEGMHRQNEESEGPLNFL